MSTNHPKQVAGRYNLSSATQYWHFSVRMVRRGDRVRISRHCNPEDGQVGTTAILILSRPSDKNDYGELLFFSQGDVVATIHTSLYSLVCWVSLPISLDLPIPPRSLYPHLSTGFISMQSVVPMAVPCSSYPGWAHISWDGVWGEWWVEDGVWTGERETTTLPLPGRLMLWSQFSRAPGREMRIIGSGQCLESWRGISCLLVPLYPCEWTKQDTPIKTFYFQVEIEINSIYSCRR